MKIKIFFAALMAATPPLLAEPPFPSPPPAPPAPPPVVKIPAPTPSPDVTAVVIANGTPPVVVALPATPSPPAPATETFVYEQKPVSGRPLLVTPDQARTIVQRFKTAYPKLGSPRFLIFVNRELIDEQSGVKLSARTESTSSVRDATSPDTNVAVTGGLPGSDGRIIPRREKARRRQDTVTGNNIYRIQDLKEMSLADRQTVRDVERLFGRPLRLSGVSLADQRIATELMGDPPVRSLAVTAEGDRSRKEREALARVVDVVIEVLISSRNVTVAEVSGDQVYAVPDIQATAIRLSDAKVLGQATASDIVGKGQYAGWVAQHFDVHDVAEATALSLMEDMMVGVSPEATVEKK
ncbi:MAG: hypothetical protein ACYDH9_10150 [Limisphaerales bacterium]